jgi:cell division protein FtsB
MSARWITPLLIALLAVVHAQLWLGRGSLGHVSELRTRLETLSTQNLEAQRYNEQLSAELRDLKEGLEMVEEQARHELGMIKSNEILVQFTK